MSTFVRPSDWPAPGEAIDLQVQDLPHASSNTEWWYVNSHVKGSDGKDYTLFAAFFRVYVRGSEENGDLEYSHAVNGAISNATDKLYYPICYMDQNAPDLIKYQLENEVFGIDSRFSRALMEVVSKGKLPKPDYVFETPVKISHTILDLDFGGNSFKKDADGNYIVSIHHPEGRCSFDMKFTPTKKVMHQGNDGIVSVAVKSETMFYYSIPRTIAEGTMHIDGKPINVSGLGWYDHEYGGERRENVYGPSTTNKGTSEIEKDKSHAWNWFAIQLENGVDISMTNLLSFDPIEIKKKRDAFLANKKAQDALNPPPSFKNKVKDVEDDIIEMDDEFFAEVVDNFVVGLDEKSAYFEENDLIVNKSDRWISVRTSCAYYLTWKMKSAKLDMDLTLTAAFPEQEVLSMTAKPAFWEGRLNVVGTFRGEPVRGLGILERHNFSKMNKLDYFFKRISEVVRQEIRNIVPINASRDHVRDLMADEENDHFMNGADVEVFNSTISNPLRDVIDRGGKAWRSYALILCIDVVGGNSFKFKHWLAMPEIMHVGSLIIDDIQDKSDFRRGKKTCHKLIGEPLAINAGTAAYFIAIDALLRMTPDITGETRLRLYERYFLTLRAGHAGQAFDIFGLDHKMKDVCSGTTNPESLVENVICTHRLKSAVPAGNLAYMGVLIGGGKVDVAQLIYSYFESIGIAFQIIDDVLNLHIPEQKEGEPDVMENTADIGKLPCEDLRCGKITFPVVMGFTKLSAEERTRFWELLQISEEEKNTRQYTEAEVLALQGDEKLAYATKRNEVIRKVKLMMGMLNKVDALKQSKEYAEKIVSDAWAALDPHIDDSFYKLMLRSFGWYVLERHY